MFSQFAHLIGVSYSEMWISVMDNVNCKAMLAEDVVLHELNKTLRCEGLGFRF